MSGDDEIVVTTRQSSRLSRRADRVFRPALFAQGGRRPQAGARRSVRPDLVQHLGRHAARSRCWSSISTARRSSIRSTSSEVKDDHAPHDHDVGGPGRGDPRSRRSARSKAAACSAATSAPRRAAASIANRRRPRKCRRISSASNSSKRSSRRTSCRIPRNRPRSKLFSPTTLGLTDTLRTLQNLSLTVRDEMSLPLSLPDKPQGVPLAAARRGAAADHRGDDARAKSACATRCARFRKNAPPTTRSTGSC